jgi:hypothetical protein
VVVAASFAVVVRQSQRRQRRALFTWIPTTARSITITSELGTEPMRKLLILLSALLCVTGHAANFDNAFTTNKFANTNQISASANTASIKSGALQTNLTGIGTATIDGTTITGGTLRANNVQVTNQLTALLFLYSSNAVAGKVLTSDALGFAGWSNAPSGSFAGGTGTVNTLPKWTATNALGDSRVRDTGLLMSIGYVSNSPPNLNDITNSTDVIGIGFSALGNAAITNSNDILAYGVEALSFTSADNIGSVITIGNQAFAFAFATNTLEVVAIGAGALSSSIVNDSTAVHAIGSSSMSGAVILDSDGVYAFGGSTFNGAVTTNSSGIYAFGSSAMDSAVMEADDVYAYGISALATATLSPFSGTIFAYGSSAMSGMVVSNAAELYAYGTSAMANSTGDGQSQIYAYGDSALEGSTLDTAFDIIALGTSAGQGGDFTGLQHVMILGSNGQATNSNDYVFGDSAYNYFFPGPFATFAGAVKLSGNTNQYTDDGSTLLRNGVPITAAGPTANGISDCVTLTYTTTNLTASSIDWNATNVCYTLLLTNHILIGDNASINVPVTTKHKYIELNLIQDGTGGWAVKFTNSIYGGVNGTIALTTNANAWDSLVLVNGKQTNGSIMVLPSNYLHR